MNTYEATYIEAINQAWKKRQARNASYSLRALARDLEISPTGLSLVLNNKRPLTIDRAIIWASKLQFSESERQTFLEAVTRSSDDRLNPNNKKSNLLEERIQYMQIQLDQFALISDWYHVAILNLCELKNFKHDESWMSKQLGITKEQCSEAIERLIRLGLIKLEDKKYSRIGRSICTPSDIPSQALRNYHRQNIERALTSLDEDSVDERDITSIIMPVEKAKLAEAKKMIRNFRREMSLFLETQNGDQVYSLNIQLFPQNIGEEETA